MTKIKQLLTICGELDEYQILWELKNYGDKHVSPTELFDYAVKSHLIEKTGFYKMRGLAGYYPIWRLVAGGCN